MKKCPHCGGESANTAILCQHCGEIIYNKKGNEVRNKTMIGPVILFTFVICGFLFFLYQFKRQIYMQQRQPQSGSEPEQAKTQGQEYEGRLIQIKQDKMQQEMQEEEKFRRQLAQPQRLQEQANTLQSSFDNSQQAFQQEQQQEEQKQLLGQNCRTICNPGLMYSDGKTMGMNCYTQCD
jgi:hypothetical protein